MMRVRDIRVAAAFAGIVLLAGCSAVTHAGLTSARSYVACTTLVGGCTGSQMKTRPANMLLSGDGSRYVKALTWRGWGTATATGTGTALLDNCKPNCAQGSDSRYPVTIVLTRPESWHGELAYTRAAATIPATGLRQTFTGLLPTRSPGAPPPAPSSPPSPGPVSGSATLSGTCEMGYEPANGDGSGQVAGYGPFVQGPPGPPVGIGGTRYEPTLSYQVAFTDTGSTTAQIGGFAVAFYDAAGNEVGSDQASAGDTFITANQTLSWTEYSPTDTAGNGLYGSAAGTSDSNIPAGAATCSVLQWSTAY
jgi:hypothetical protein